MRKSPTSTSMSTRNICNFADTKDISRILDMLQFITGFPITEGPRSLSLMKSKKAERPERPRSIFMRMGRAIMSPLQDRCSE